ncbi:hypothetical protein GCM10017744_085900 [Streptomyces antimycoticus]|uniref:Aromatic ring-opening dioxygenase LigA n=1 Tax=Streptomyces antimycoticus TaxID=68175 RepID=A0A4D4JVB2_9ACTN|nr:hypothetical protein [Streptomyces antimycoticus]GDY40665.1 hypothetical protein SANT12839_015470 [Streptomyces antimycoticus]
MARSAVSALLILLGCLLVPVSVLTVWVHDIVLDTDRYVATVAPLAKDPAIQDTAVDQVSAAVDIRHNSREVTADIASWLRAHGLPEQAADTIEGLAPQLDSALDQAVRKVAAHIVRSEQFPAVWTGANRAAHTAVVGALTGKGGGPVGVEGHTVTLNVGAAVERVRQQLVDAGLPVVTGIPDIHQRLVLFHSDRLDTIRRSARLLDLAGNWLPALTVTLGGTGVLLAHRRRRALARAALGTALASLALALALAVGRRYYLDHVPASVLSREAASVLFDTVVRFLRVTVLTALVLGVVVALGAYLVGPGRLPSRVRGTAEVLADSAARWGAAHGMRTGRAGIWTADHRRGLTTAALLVPVAVFALWNHPTVLTVLFLVLILLAALAVIALLAATGRTGAHGRGR